jgi:hypothetical protein
MVEERNKKRLDGKVASLTKGSHASEYGRDCSNDFLKRGRQREAYRALGYSSTLIVDFGFGANPSIVMNEVDETSP